MAELNTGLRSILRNASIYGLWQSLVGNHQAKIRYVRDFIKPISGERVLDIGCGPGSILEYLPSTLPYVGFDFNEQYILKARVRYGHRGTFFVAEVRDGKIIEGGIPLEQHSFDIVTVNGVLHHLNDSEVKVLFQFAVKMLKPSGRLMSFDGVYCTEQSRIARWIISKDRGQNVRTEAQYRDLTLPFFGKVTCSVRHDMYRIPYSLIIMECRKPNQDL